uniref:BLTX550 n=1 Tax=Nephila pilipes TaxID=299642 RepID=A0A076KV36_NEPPI|nr:BLTX550 [Nephila pilipes]
MGTLIISLHQMLFHVYFILLLVIHWHESNKLKEWETDPRLYTNIYVNGISLITFKQAVK